MWDNGIVLIGYSGHAYVVADAILKSNLKISGYCDTHQKSCNPFNLLYLGNESESSCKESLTETPIIVAIGDNKLREKISHSLSHCSNFITVIHPSATIGSLVTIGKGAMIMASCTINTLSNIGNGVICNTGSIIEHEAEIGDFAHIAPGAVLAGNVTIGKRTFVGANSVIKQGIIVGDDVVIGAGAVVVANIPSGEVVIGNPAKKLKRK